MEDVVQTSMSTKVEDFLVLIPSTQTQKNYRTAIRKFEAWLSRPITSLLNEQSTTLSRVLERYYIELKKKYKQNTCRFYVNSVTQYFKFHGKEIQFRRGLGVNNAEVTTRDHPDRSRRAGISQIYVVPLIEWNCLYCLYLIESCKNYDCNSKDQQNCHDKCYRSFYLSILTLSLIKVLFMS